MLEVVPVNGTAMIDTDNSVWVDVDKTLLFHRNDPPEGSEFDPNWTQMTGCDGKTMDVLPHWKQVEFVKTLHRQGLTVVMWSAAGKNWAWRAREFLGLQDYVDFVFTKPRFYLDDVDSSHFMGKPSYIPYKPPQKTE